LFQTNDLAAQMVRAQPVAQLQVHHALVDDHKDKVPQMPAEDAVVQAVLEAEETDVTEDESLLQTLHSPTV
jgi:hypothetical protein